MYIKINFIEEYEDDMRKSVKWAEIHCLKIAFLVNKIAKFKQMFIHKIVDV
jgi:hypothetical protein